MQLDLVPQPRTSSGVGTVAAMRTGGRGPVGQSGSAPVRRTVPGTISAAGAFTSKGNAPNSIGAAPERSAASAAGTTQKRACTPSATRAPLGPHSAKGGSLGHLMINPSAPSCRNPCSNPQIAIEAVSMAKRLPSTSGSSSQRVITAREK